MDLTDEMQWVLRNARLHAPDRGLRSAAGFAQGAGRAEPVHRAQVGRWERGGVEVTRALVRRYETVLELPEGLLLSAIDLFSRSREPIRSAATLPARQAPDVDATLELLERALSTERMSGVDWDRLSDAIGRMPHVLVRPADWEALFRRLLEESSLSLQLDYTQRTEALARLTGHPRSGPVVAAMAREVTARPDAQFYNDTLSLLQFTDHPDVLSVVLGQLRDPTNTSSLRGCLIALTTLVRSRSIPASVREEIAHLAVRHLRDPAQPYHVHRGAANVIRALGLRNTRLETVLTAQDRRAAASIVRDGRAIGVQAVRDAQRRIRAALEEDDELEAGASEPVLTALVETALVMTNEEDRSNALAILMISPQAPIIGQVHARAFAEAWRQGDLVGAQESLTVLMFVAQEPDLDLFERVALGRETQPEVSMGAGYVVGNTIESRTRRRDERERAFARRVVEVVRAGGGQVEADQVRGLVYVLGMRGRRDLLRAVAEALPPASGGRRPGRDAASVAHGASVAPVARSILDYWLGLPEHLRPAW
jgi:hypothetical protein